MKKIPVLEVQEGPQKGQRFSIFDGAKLSDVQSDIVIKDSYINGLSCVIQQQGEGKFALFSQRNESPLQINSRSVKKVSLLPGVLFFVGQTPLKVIQIEEKEAELLAQKESWLDQLKSFLSGLKIENNKNLQKQMHYKQPIEIEFTQGPLSNEMHSIGYLPRVFGTAQIGFDLQDLSLPREVFMISAEKNDVFVSHLSTIPVFVNDKKIEAKTKIKTNDRISCGSTELRISSL